MLELRDVYKSGEIFRNVSPSESLTSRYYDFVVKQYKSKVRKSKNFSVSGLGGCGLKAIYDYYTNNTEYKLPANNYTTTRSIEITKLGDKIHSRFQDTFADMNILYGLWECKSCGIILGEDNRPYGIKRPDVCLSCGKEAGFEYKEIDIEVPELRLKGRTDGIIKISDDSEMQIVDFKSCGGYSFGEIEKKKQPDKSHIIQINAYLWLFNLESAYIFYENRDKLVHKEFYVKKDGYIVERIENLVKYLNYLVDNGKVPAYNDPNLFTASEVGPESKYCSGYYGFPPCKYYHICFPEEFHQKGGNLMFHGMIKIS